MNYGVSAMAHTYRFKIANRFHCIYKHNAPTNPASAFHLQWCLLTAMRIVPVEAREDFVQGLDTGFTPLVSLPRTHSKQRLAVCPPLARDNRPEAHARNVDRGLNQRQTSGITGVPLAASSFPSLSSSSCLSLHNHVTYL